MNTETPTLTPQKIDEALAEARRLRSEAMVAHAKAAFRFLTGFKPKLDDGNTLRPTAA